MKPHFACRLFLRCAIAASLAAVPGMASPALIAIGTLGDAADRSTFPGLLENGIDHNNTLGGLGSGLAWAGGSTFLAAPDRGPNAAVYAAGAALDNTTSYISRFNTVTLALMETPSHPSVSNALPFTLKAALQKTTLLYSPAPLRYGAVAPEANTAGKFYFSGRSDNFAPGSVSTDPGNARLDVEGIRVSRDGGSVFVSDEYGPHVYQFNRATGARIKVFTLPSDFTVSKPNAVGANETSANTRGRVANKGMEGLAITPDGATLAGLLQSALIQDGGDGKRVNRIVTIDTATGKTCQYVYDTFLADQNKNFNTTELLAINNHEFLVLERNSNGLGAPSPAEAAIVKRLYKIDLHGATDIGPLHLSGEANLLAHAVPKSLFMDLRLLFNAAGVVDTNIPSKLEGIAFGEDVTIGGVIHHTLYLANDNDFAPATGGPSNFYVFSFTEGDLNGSLLQPQSLSALP